MPLRIRTRENRSQQTVRSRLSPTRSYRPSEVQCECSHRRCAWATRTEARGPCPLRAASGGGESPMFLSRDRHHELDVDDENA